MKIYLSRPSCGAHILLHYWYYKVLGIQAFLSIKVIIEKSHGEGFLMEQDAIVNEIIIRHLPIADMNDVIWQFLTPIFLSMSLLENATLPWGLSHGKIRRLFFYLFCLFTNFFKKMPIDFFVCKILAFWFSISNCQNQTKLLSNLEFKSRNYFHQFFQWTARRRFSRGRHCR